MKSPIDSSKLLPPRSAGHVVARERLHARLLEARHRRCFVLRGPAGCGKTTTLTSWRQMLLPLGFDFAWLTLTSDDNELTRFLDYLLASVAQVAPALVREASQLEGRGTDSEAVERTIITLVRGIASHKQELVLVLDDLHNLTDAGIHEALQWLIDYAPANLHLVLVSRSALPLSLARLRSLDLILELDLRDLRFTPAESEQFLKGQLGDIDPSEARQLHELTDGWIAGLQLLSVSRKKHRQEAGEPLAKTTLAPAQVRDILAFEKFFESEVLAQLAPTDLDLLLLMAVCNRFCASLCAALTGHPESTAKAAVLLTRLENDNLFLIRVDSPGQEPWYRLHPLLRETLLKHFDSRSPTEQRAVHAHAWVWFRDHDQLDAAVRHAVLGGEAAAAALLIESRAEALYAHGDLRMLIELVRQLPAEQVQARIPLSILMVRLYIYSRNFAAAAESLERLEHAVPPGDSAARFRLTLLHAALAVQRDDTDSAMRVLPQLLQPPPDADGIMLGGSLNILSWLYMHRGEYEQARRIQIDRPPLLVNGAPLQGTSAGSLQGRCLIGLSLALQGQMTQAERVYREVLYEAERGGKVCADAMYLAAALLGEVLYEINDVETAHKLLSSWVDVLERISIPDSVLRVMQVLWKSEWLAGNRLESFAYLERLEEYAIKLGLDRLLTYSLAWQIHWHLLLGELVAAETKLARLATIDARHPHAENSALREIHILAENAQIRWQIALGDLQGASQRLKRLIELCETGGWQQAVVRLLVLGAVIDAQLGKSDGARENIIEALRRGHRFGLIRSLIDAHPTALELIGEVARNETLDPVLVFYVERLQATERTPLSSPPNAPAAARERRLLAPGMEPLKEREIEIVRLLAQALPNKKIARALGLSPETVKWHLSHIYSKLGVNSRDEAVARMRDLESPAGED